MKSTFLLYHSLGLAVPTLDRRGPLGNSDLHRLTAIVTGDLQDLGHRIRWWWGLGFTTAEQCGQVLVQLGICIRGRSLNRGFEKTVTRRRRWRYRFLGYRWVQGLYCLSRR